MSQQIRSSTALLLCAALALNLAGCSLHSSQHRALHEPHEVSRLDEAGSAHVAVLSVGYWDDFVEALQPTFKLSEQQALDAVMASTRALEEQFVDVLKGGLEIATPSTSTTSTVTQTSDAEGNSTTSESTKERKPGDASSLEAPTGEGVTSASALGPESSVLGRNIAVDAMSRYWAATALHQEVQLLNRYVKNARRLQPNMEPYVVRLQLSLLPSARNEPYDAYSTVSFFSSREGQGILTAGGAAKGIVPVSTQVDARFEAFTHELASLPAAEDARKQLEDLKEDLKKLTEPPGDTPIVVPLLVTDNLEVTAHSRALDRVRQFGLALGFMINGFGGSAKVMRQIEELQTVLGNDINSLLTVARVSDNTIRVRLGAQQQVSANYAMVPQTHNISLLLFVPRELVEKGPGEIQAVAKTELLHATTGFRLPNRTERQQRQLVVQLQEAYKPYLEDSKPACKRKLKDTPNLERDILSLLFHVESNDYTGFVDLLSKPDTVFTACIADPATFPRDALWVDMVSLTVGSEYAAARFYAPGIRSPVGFPAQTVLVLDDTKAASTATVRGGRHWKAEQLSATLEVTASPTPTPPPKPGATPAPSPSPAPPSNPITRQFLATKVATDEEGAVATFTFPSFQQWLAGGSKFQLSTGNLEVRSTDPVASRTFQSIYLAKEEKENAKAKYSLTIYPGFVAADERARGSMNVGFTFDKDGPEKIQLEVIGADLDHVVCITPATGCALFEGGVFLPRGQSRSIVVKLSLSNLHALSKIQVKASTGADDKEPVTKEVPVMPMGAAYQVTASRPNP